MGSFILKTRLEILSSNLRNVARVMELAQRRAQEIDALKSLLFGPEGVRDLARRLKNRVERSIRDLNDDELDSAIQALTDANGFVQALADKLDSSQSAVSAVLGPPVELSTRLIHQRLIAEVQRVLDNAGPQTAAWQMEAKLSRESEPLFAEYVDLLRGLALRETGIERGICELADRLLDGCSHGTGPEWKSLAVPSYRGPSGLTSAQIIRLGFPEWTIWALPLAAHEFGRIIASTDPELGQRIVQEGGTTEETKAPLIAALADAFATYSVGPAYACTAVLMRLDPRPARANGAAVDDLRARMIFEMLKVAQTDAGSAVNFEGVCESLSKAWTEAVAEAGAAPPGPAPTELAGFFWRWVDRSYRPTKYTPKSWLKAQQLQEAIEKHLDSQALDADDGAAIPGGAGEVRDMLNAAWLCRLKTPDRADVIAEKALAVWQRAVSQTQKPGRLAAHGVVQPSGRTS
jgi:hypothetical protein